MQIDPSSFLLGLVLGAIFTIAITLIAGRIYQAWLLMGTPDQPMNVTTPTQHTPRQIMVAAAAAFWTILQWAFVLFLLIVVFVLILQILVSNP